MGLGGAAGEFGVFAVSKSMCQVLFGLWDLWRL